MSTEDELAALFIFVSG